MAGLRYICLSLGLDPVSICRQWLKKAGPTAGDNSTAQERVDPKEREALFREFADYLRTPKPRKVALHLDPTRREALFRDFVEYRKRQQAIIAYYDTTSNH